MEIIRQEIKPCFLCGCDLKRILEPFDYVMEIPRKWICQECKEQKTKKAVKEFIDSANAKPLQDYANITTTTR